MQCCLQSAPLPGQALQDAKERVVLAIRGQPVCNDYLCAAYANVHLGGQ